MYYVYYVCTICALLETMPGVRTGLPRAAQLSNGLQQSSLSEKGKGSLEVREPLSVWLHLANMDSEWFEYNMLVLI